MSTCVPVVWMDECSGPGVLAGTYHWVSSTINPISNTIIRTTLMNPILNTIMYTELPLDRRHVVTSSSPGLEHDSSASSLPPPSLRHLVSVGVGGGRDAVSACSLFFGNGTVGSCVARVST